MNAKILTFFGVIGSYLSYLFGGWTAAMTTLMIFMGADYFTGIIVAAVFKKSPKTENGALESRAGFKGLLRKGVILLMVLIAHRLDMVLGVCFIKDGVITAYILNETVSIIENMGLMGVPIPQIIKKAIEMLKKTEDENYDKT